MRPRFAGAIYGILIVGTLLAVESARQETYGETIGAIVLAIVLYWLAHAYAELTGRRLREGQPLTLQGSLSAMAEWSLIPVGAILPLIALLIAWAFGAQLTGAVSAGIWTAAGSLVVIELAAGIRASHSWPELLFQATAGSLLGLGIVALRIVLH